MPRGATRVVLASLAGAAVAAAVVAAVWLGQTGQEATPAEVPSEHAPGSLSQPAAGNPRAQGGIRDSLVGPYLSESAQVRVTVPTLGVTSDLVELGLTAAGAMQVPTDPAVAGWYTRGPAPGALGPAVIAGHVTWDGEPAVFYELGSLRSGDTVEVDRSDGKTAVFTVQRVARFPKDEFPTQAVYGPVNHASLRLITCGGLYDESNSRYLDNVVVFARLAEVRRPAS